MTLVYILKLSHGCFYVGTTSFSIANCIKDHMIGNGVEWTKLHKPIALVKQIEYSSSTNPRLQQDLHVKQLMLDHGMEKVRGGSYPAVALTREQTKSLKRELWYAELRCCRCGRRSHRTEDCSAERDVTGDLIDTDQSEMMENNDQQLSSLMSNFDSVAIALLESKDVENRIKDCVRATRSLIEVVSKRHAQDIYNIDDSSSASKRTHKKVYSATEMERNKNAPNGVNYSPDSVVTTSLSKCSIEGEDKASGIEYIKEDRERRDIDRHDSGTDTSSIKTIDITDSAVQEETKTARGKPCCRCGRYSHHRSRCYEELDVHGFDLTDCF